MKANHDGQVNMELDFSIVQAIIVCLVVVSLAPKAAAVLAVALLCCAVDRTKASNNASKPTKTRERFPEAPRIIKQESGIRESSPVRQGVTNKVFLLLFSLLHLALQSTKSQYMLLCRFSC